MSMIQTKNPKRFQGFTIVELLIVVVVIAILAAITIVAYNGIQTKAKNTARLNELKAWQKLFMTYKAANDKYPAMVVGREYCLGTGFPIGYGGVARCHNYESSTTSPLESDNSSIMNELKTIGSLPTGSRAPLGGLAAPYAGINSSGTVILTTAIEGQTCPDGTQQNWTDGSNRVTCVLYAE